MDNVSVELTNKLHDIQDELNRLSSAYDMGEPGVSRRYEELKEEFTSLLFEMRRRKSLADYGNNIMINIEVNIIFIFFFVGKEFYLSLQ